jgi:predicted Zn-dependent protease
MRWEARRETKAWHALARLRALLGAVLVCLVGGCVATGQHAPDLLTPDEEVRIGAAAHGEIVSQFGGEYEEPHLDSYLSALVGRLAAASGSAAIDYRVTVLDSPGVNAFASTGGYLYVTRGLLALANDEAEIASVLAHELGHLHASHSAKRQAEAARASFLGGVLASLSGSPYVADVLSFGAASYVAKYSRDQEHEADERGIVTASRAGYDPFSAATFLASLQRHFELEGQLSPGAHAEDASLLSTHPSTPERVERARTAAFAQGDAPAGYVRSRDAYLDLIDGLPFGDNPRHGLVDGRTFSQPDRRFRFEVPDGFEILNRNDVVLARGPEDAVIIFDGASLEAQVSLEDHLLERWGDGLELHNLRDFDVNGMPAVGAETLHRGFGHELVAIKHSDGVVYRFLFITRPMVSANYEAAFRATVNSFRRLSEAEARAIQPLRVRLVAVGAGDTVATLARGMAVGDAKEERFRVLNGLDAQDEPEPGTRVKIISP